MPEEKKWDMETAARLLQYGATGKTVAEAVGCSPAVISRHKDELLSMAVEPLSQQETEQLIRKKEPFKLEPDAPKIEPAAEAATEIGEAVEDMREALEEMTEEDQTIVEPPLLAVKQPAIVNIDIGHGMVCLETEDERTLEMLCAMLAAVGEDQQEMFTAEEPVTHIQIDIGRGKARMESESVKYRNVLVAMLAIMAENKAENNLI